MSLRCASRALYQAGIRVVQGMKEQAPKCDSTLKSLGDSACCSSSSCSSSCSSSSSSSKRARRFSGAVDSSAFRAAKNDRLKQAEESLRTVMYLSCWGPN